MAYQATFQRYEAKYLLTALEKEQILKKCPRTCVWTLMGEPPFGISTSIQILTGLSGVPWKSLYIRKNCACAAIRPLVLKTPCLWS